MQFLSALISIDVFFLRFIYPFKGWCNDWLSLSQKRLERIAIIGYIVFNLIDYWKRMAHHTSVVLLIFYA